MFLNSDSIAKTEKAILVGLYLSKYDSLGLKNLGFESFTEAFNVLGYAVGVPPGSIKNYRDEFDPMFDNPRRGWHKRSRRENCLKVFEEYKNLDLELFIGLIKSFGGYDDTAWTDVLPGEEQADGESQFAKRLITGLAAERYFEKIHHNLPEFNGCTVQNTTQFGCGYDFRLQSENSDDFVAVEVKGMKGRTGGLSLTQREHRAAMTLKNRFYLFVVKNFREIPFHEIFQNPLSGDLDFRQNKRMIVQISWLVNV